MNLKFKVFMPKNAGSSFVTDLNSKDEILEFAKSNWQDIANDASPEDLKRWGWDKEPSTIEQALDVITNLYVIKAKLF